MRCFFLAVAGLPCCVQAFLVAEGGGYSGCCVWASHCGGFSLQNVGFRLLGITAETYLLHGMWNQTHVLHCGRQILNHWKPPDLQGSPQIFKCYVTFI